MGYLFISLPLRPAQDDKHKAWQLLQEKTSFGTQLSSNFKLDVPELRIGTLDTLMQLSDDLVKVNAGVDAVVSKIRRTVYDIAGASAVSSLKVENLPVEAYLTRFRWDEPKYPLRRPLKETVEKIAEITAHIEDELKVKVSEYNNIKSQLSAATRKAGGSLAVRDVSTVVKPEQVVDSENLTTLFVVVSKFNIKEWDSSYEKLCDFVVPRSSKIICEDQDYALASVVLFKRVADDFRTAARVRGFQVRDYTPAAPASTSEPTGSIDDLKRDGEAKRAALENWCKTAYGEVFEAWTHLCVIRLFVESILRYGLPPAFLAVVVKPVPKLEGRLRAKLAETFGTDSAYWKDDAAATGASAVGGSELDSYPYVSLSVNVD